MLKNILIGIEDAKKEVERKNNENFVGSN